MNDTPSKQNPDESRDETASSVDAAQTKYGTPSGMLPLGEPVFGKRAFLITAVPFLIYLAGTGFGAHLESIRKTAPAHDMRSRCRTMADDLSNAIEASLPPEQATQLLNRMDFAKVRAALDDESSDVATLFQQCETLLNDQFEDLAEQTRKPLLDFQSFVAHFFELAALEEEHEIDQIREVHLQWLESRGHEGIELNESWYPTLYSIACLTSLVVVIFALPGYLKIPFQITGMAIGVGVLGIVVWLGLWWVDKEFLGIGDYFSPNARAGFNPWLELADNPLWMWTFLLIRLLGLCLVIPIAEEFFARGFLMRYIEDIDWDQIPVGAATWRGWAGIIAYGAMTHPGEIVAAVAWFGLVTWMYLRTKNIWDCVVAHSVTNILLAAYVLGTETWELW